MTTRPPETYCPSAAPPNALRMWTDGARIFVELPGGVGPPHIVDYKLCEAGLSRALDLLRDKAKVDYAGAPQRRDLPRVGTALQHASAAALLRKRGII